MSVESKTLKNPVKALEGILGGLTKTMIQLDQAKQAADAYIAKREEVIAKMEQEKKTAESVAEKAGKVSDNLKQLLAVD